MEETTLENNRDYRKSFWTRGRIIIAAAFIIGLAIGFFATNKYIDPYINGSKIADQNELIAENSMLDARADWLYNCLIENNVPPSVCNPIPKNPQSTEGNMNTTP